MRAAIRICCSCLCVHKRKVVSCDAGLCGPCADDVLPACTACLCVAGTASGRWAALPSWCAAPLTPPSAWATLRSLWPCTRSTSLTPSGRVSGQPTHLCILVPIAFAFTPLHLFCILNTMCLSTALLQELHLVLYAWHRHPSRFPDASHVLTSPLACNVAPCCIPQASTGGRSWRTSAVLCWQRS